MVQKHDKCYEVIVWPFGLCSYDDRIRISRVFDLISSTSGKKSNFGGKWFTEVLLSQKQNVRFILFLCLLLDFL